MNNTNDIEKIDIKRMIEIVLERIVSIVVITLIFGLISFAFSNYFITRKYESSITLYVNNGRSFGENSGGIGQQKILSSDITASQQLVPTYIEMIKSNAVLDEVAEDVEKKTKKKYRAGSIRDLLTVEAVANTEIIKVSVRTTDPGIAREIAYTISEIAPGKIQEFVEGSEVKIIDAAKISGNPVSPDVRMNTIIGALLGFVLSISFILLKELFDVRIKLVDDLVSKFNYPVLGTIPEIYISYDDAYEDSEQEN